MRRRGTVLLTVLVVTAAGAMLAATLLFRMTAEVAVSDVVKDSGQARRVAMAGIERATALVRGNLDDPSAWTDNPEALANQFVCEANGQKWYFTVYACNPADPTAVRYGVTDESGKINVNLADEGTLRGLFQPLAGAASVEELVDCLLDFREKGGQPRPHGAKQEYYDTLNPPYLVRGGLLATLGELLLVKGFTASIVYGEDANLNGLLEANENDGDESFPPDDGDGVLNTGLRHVAAAGLTYGPDVDSQGRPRVNINDPAAVAKAGLPPPTAEFIRLYLEEGNALQHPSELLEMRYALKKEHDGHKAGEKLESGVGREELPEVLDRLTVPGSRAGLEIGRVNVNTAPRAVLAALPDVGPELADRIVEARRQRDAEGRRTPAWLYGEALIEDAAAFQKVAPLFRCRGYQYHVQCVAFSSRGGQFQVLEAMVDLARGPGRIVYLRDLTHLGLPFALDAQAGHKKE
jgi:type II secretory pathway component PulK